MKWEIDNLLKHPEPFTMPETQASELKLRSFKQILEHHYNNCSEYREYCDLYKFSPHDVTTLDDFVKIPPIPSDAFRGTEKPIMSVPAEKIILVPTTSSTTSKNPCRYALDAESLSRANLAGKHLLADIGLKGGFAGMLHPPPEESDTGMVRSMSHMIKKRLKFGDRMVYAVHGGKMEIENVIKAITTTTHRPVHLYGFPFVYMHFVDYIERQGLDIRMDADSRLITTGGWKTVTGEVPKQELNERMAKAFRVKEDQIRDGYGLTDIYTMIMECEHHNKHVPPWLHVSARDPADMNTEVDEGEEGLLVLMSSFITSFPAIVATGDMGAVWNKKKCECGRHGQIVEHRGRGSKLGARSCAIRIEQFMENITRK